MTSHLYRLFSQPARDHGPLPRSVGVAHHTPGWRDPLVELAVDDAKKVGARDRGGRLGLEAFLDESLDLHMGASLEL